MTFSVARWNETDGQALIQNFQRCGFIALLGSRISAWEPSNLPAGMDITRTLARLLAAPLAYYPATIISLIERTAFEHIMQACPEYARDILGENIAKLYAVTKPNPVHEAIAALIDSGVIQHVITTNYDDGIEQACRAHGGARSTSLQVVVYEPVATVYLARPILFKIHGCAAADAGRSPGSPRSIVFHLAQEGLLDSWKRGLLTDLLVDRNLLICGYSGLDFEICPEIQFLGPRIKKLGWNAFHDPRIDKRSLTPNALRVLESVAGMALVGDMVEILKQLWPPLDISKVKGSPVRDVTADLTTRIDAWSLDVWRLSIFSSIGCAAEGVRLAQEMAVRAGGDPLKQWTAFHGMGQALFHEGSYHCSANWYLRASKVAAANGLAGEHFRAEMDAAEAERAAGHWLRASRRRERISAARGGPPHFGVFLRRALGRKGFYAAAKQLHLLTRGFTRWFETTLRTAAEGAIGAGSWLDYQQCVMIAEELGLDRARIFMGLTAPMPSQPGYQHLGYFLAECQAIRNAMRRGEAVPDLPELVWRLDRLWELGAMPEMSKLAFAIRKSHGGGVLSRLQCQRAVEGFRRCEYMPWARCATWFRYMGF